MKKRKRYSRKFQKMAVERMKTSEDVVDRGRQGTNGNLDDLRDAELAILREGTVTADVNSTIDRARAHGRFLSGR